MFSAFTVSESLFNPHSQPHTLTQRELGEGGEPPRHPLSHRLFQAVMLARNNTVHHKHT